MGIGKSIKTILNFMMIASFVGCGGSPSISILPSTDDFEQQGSEITAKMDILWVIDNSGSMADFQAAVEANLITFMENFSNKGFDFQIAVTVSDGWQDMDYSNYVADGGPTFSASNKSRFRASLDGTRVLSSTEDSAVLLQKFEEIIADVGTSGSGDERVMQSTQAAILNPLNVADGFFREDAHLAIIFVSDEEDTSWRSNSFITVAPGCSATNATELYGDGSGYMIADCAAETESVSYFANFLDSNSNEVLGATVHNMTIEEGDDICRTSDASFQRYFGVRTSELATLTGGTISSLCGDFAESLDKIAQTIIETTVEFPLNGIPPSDPSTIQVFVKAPGEADFPSEGVPNNSDNGWTYNAAANSIVFHGDGIPAQGSSIRVLYDPGSL